jgi:hypothetical protein
VDEGGAAGAGHRGVGAADGAPDHFVQQEVVGGVFVREVEAFGHLGAPGGFFVVLVEGPLRGERGERTGIGLDGEAGVHRAGGGVELAHRGEAEDELHRPQHAARRVHLAHDGVTLYPRAHDQRDRSMCVDVVGAVLGVVLDHENRERGPERALRQRLDHSADGEVVLRDVRARRESADLRARRVIVRQAQHDQARHLVALLESGELREKRLARSRSE